MAAETPTIVLVHGAWADATGFAYLPYGVSAVRYVRQRGDVSWLAGPR
jgi:hypothetical protein